MIRAIILCLEDVVYDAASHREAAWEEALSSCDVPLPLAITDDLSDLSGEEAVQLLSTMLDISEQDAAAAFSAQRALYADRIAKLGPQNCRPGTRELLNGLSTAGVRIAAVTRASSAYPSDSPSLLLIIHFSPNSVRGPIDS